MTKDLARFSPRALPGAETMSGRSVDIVPIVDESRFGELCETFAGIDEAQWRYLGYGPFGDADELLAALRKTAFSSGLLLHAIVPKDSGKASGWIAFMRADPANGVIEIGHVSLGPALKRSRAATEGFFLMMRRAFDELGYRRLEWKCDSGNQPSRQAAARLGFTYEGTFRQHMVVKGRNRDTAWFSIIDGEWPALKAAFEAWLADDNFDGSGQQKRRLSGLMTMSA
ncbi:GNAT family N-acetyltransferase [Consotaella salsifontis]|uniref:Protein N-acetyltransferase, RimJ/RimL family n=1 Tax=Consotaella salsifontis TaxID=1365950 RepID=A0A1T4NJF8_9HYPH|nr:GNAT family protein [Consotaella salsifontis]SJZ79451.1 Protein N-acetyltransferase, RimJ/RimL family [Consotaella salsifontis]